MRIFLWLFFSFFLFVNVSGCIVTNPKYDKLMPGIWRGELFLDKQNVPIGDVSKVTRTRDIDRSPSFTEGVLPFNFEVSYEHDSLVLTFRNGTQRIPVKNISWGRNKRNARDTILIRFVEYDTYIRAEHDEGILTGAFYMPRKNMKIPFRAISGKSYRFSDILDAPSVDITGHWRSVFDPSTQPDTAIGEFHQKGNYLDGTFLSPTGDYGFLEGSVDHDRFYLSSFDGGHVYLFSGKVIGQDSLDGLFYSGNTYKTTWIAEKDNKIHLPDATSLIHANNQPVTIRFSDPDRKIVDINDPSYAGKYKIVQVMGTWCPNCKDETVFLTEYKRQNPNDKLQYLALAFEAYTDSSRVFHLLKSYKAKMNMDYPVLWAGKASGKDASAKLPFLSKIMAFPTLFILDKDNRVIYTHTGFSGPATSQYDAFKNEFKQTVQELIK